MFTQILLASLLGMQTGSPGLAWDVSAFHNDASQPQVFVPSAKQERECSRKGSVCFSAADSTTMQSAKVEPNAVLTRDTQPAKEDVLQELNSTQPWQVEMVANFKAHSTKAPIEVDVQDADDPPSRANIFARVVWNVDMKPDNHLGMRVTLPPNEGFDPWHSYRVRILQRQGKTRRLLAEGRLHLG